jgi:hypothetical protein
MNPTSGFSDQSSPAAQDVEVVPARRMFIFETGWRVGVKTGSTRELCYVIAPGQDFYHRLLDGEIRSFRCPPTSMSYPSKSTGETRITQTRDPSQCARLDFSNRNSNDSLDRVQKKRGSGQ